MGKDQTRYLQGWMGLSGRHPQHRRKTSRTRGVATCVSALRNACLRPEDYIIYLATSSSGDTRSQATMPASIFVSADCGQDVACRLHFAGWSSCAGGDQPAFWDAEWCLCLMSSLQDSFADKGQKSWMFIRASPGKSARISEPAASCIHSKLSNSGSSIAVGVPPPKHSKSPT